MLFAPCCLILTRFIFNYMFIIKREILISTEKHKCLLNTLQEDVIQLTATFKEIAHLGTIDTCF